MKKTFEELNAMKFDIVEHFGMQKKSEFFIMNTVSPAEYGADADYQYYEVDVQTDEDLDALKAFIEDLFGIKVYATTIKQAIKEVKSAANASPSLPAHLPDLETETENKRKP